MSSIESRPIQFDSLNDAIQNTEVSVKYNFNSEEFKEYKIKKAIEPTLNIQGLSLQVIDKGNKSTSLEFNGNSYLFNRMIFTKGVDDPTNGSSVFEYSLLLELESNVDANNKVYIVLPIFNNENDAASEDGPSDLRAFLKDIKEDDVTNENKIKGKININFLIPSSTFHYYYLNRNIFIVYDESPLSFDMSDKIYKVFQIEELFYPEEIELNAVTIVNEIYSSSSAALNRSLQGSMLDDIYIDCAPIEDSENNQKIIEPKRVYSVRPLFDTEQLGVSSKYFIMFFVSMFIFGLSYMFISNLNNIPTFTNVREMTEIIKSSSSIFTHGIFLKFTLFIFFSTFIMATYQLARKSFDKWFKKYNAILYTLLALFTMGSWIIWGAITNKLNDKNKVIMSAVKVAIIGAVVYGISYTVVPGDLRPGNIDMLLYIFFISPVIMGLLNIKKLSQQDEGSGDGGGGGGG